MPLNSTQTYIQQLINGTPLPGGIPALAAYITPPDPNEEADVPAAYVWPSTGNESRSNSGPAAGTVPRNTGAGTPSGWKNIVHMLDIWLVFFGQDDDPASDTLFPGIVDAVMAVLRTAPNPAPAFDTYTQQPSWLVDIGEKMDYRVDLRALSDQAYNRYDGLITITITEIFQSLHQLPVDYCKPSVRPATFWSKVTDTYLPAAFFEQLMDSNGAENLSVNLKIKSCLPMFNFWPVTGNSPLSSWDNYWASVHFKIMDWLVNFIVKWCDFVSDDNRCWYDVRHALTRTWLLMTTASSSQQCAKSS
jgi:hypothetical protein